MKPGQVKKGAPEYCQRQWNGEGGRNRYRHLPWPLRLQNLLLLVARAGSIRYSGCPKRQSKLHKDRQRAIREGYCAVTPRTFGTLKWLVLTDAGRQYIAPKSAAEQRTPYAKRRAGLVEFYAVNGINKAVIHG